MKYENVVILGGARDYHAVDWFRSVRNAVGKEKTFFLTDTVSSEGMENLTLPSDEISTLLLVDRFLLPTPSTRADYWRNLVKLFVLPWQTCLLRLFINKLDRPVVHAHPMYYMLLCRLAGVDYIGTPQGSELLVRATESLMYRKIARWALRGAKKITVDSVAMADAVRNISQINAYIVQNGVDTESIKRAKARADTEEQPLGILSIRGFAPLYRLEKIIEARNETLPSAPIVFAYPFWDKKYLSQQQKLLQPEDKLLGKLDKEAFHDLLVQSCLVLSIPSSDSSPRSVYEAILAGATVATIQNRWMDSVPQSFKESIVLVDLADRDWLKKAYAHAQQRLGKKPDFSMDDINNFDESMIMKNQAADLYGITH